MSSTQYRLEATMASFFLLSAPPVPKARNETPLTGAQKKMYSLREQNKKRGTLL